MVESSRHQDCQEGDSSSYFHWYHRSAYGPLLLLFLMLSINFVAIKHQYSNYEGDKIETRKLPYNDLNLNVIAKNIHLDENEENEDGEKNNIISNLYPSKYTKSIVSIEKEEKEEVDYSFYKGGRCFLYGGSDSIHDMCRSPLSFRDLKRIDELEKADEETGEEIATKALKRLKVESRSNTRPSYIDDDDDDDEEEEMDDQDDICDIFIGIISRPDAKERREAIRQTWLQDLMNSSISIPIPISNINKDIKIESAEKKDTVKMYGNKKLKIQYKFFVGRQFPLAKNSKEESEQKEEEDSLLYSEINLELLGGKNMSSKTTNNNETLPLSSHGNGHGHVHNTNKDNNDKGDHGQFYQDYILSNRSSHLIRKLELPFTIPEIEKDVVHLPFLDSYQNLSIKSTLMFSYTQLIPETKCKYLLKVDDDVYVDTKRMVDLLVDDSTILPPSSSSFVYGGRLLAHNQPIRDPSSKWYLSIDEYQANEYPLYAEGPIYFLSSSLVKKLPYTLLAIPHPHTKHEKNDKEDDDKDGEKDKRKEIDVYDGGKKYDNKDGKHSKDTKNIKEGKGLKENGMPSVLTDIKKKNIFQNLLLQDVTDIKKKNIFQNLLLQDEQLQKQQQQEQEQKNTSQVVNLHWDWDWDLVPDEYVKSDPSPLFHFEDVYVGSLIQKMIDNDKQITTYMHTISMTKNQKKKEKDEKNGKIVENENQNVKILELQKEKETEDKNLRDKNKSNNVSEDKDEISFLNIPKFYTRLNQSMYDSDYLSSDMHIAYHGLSAKDMVLFHELNKK